VKRCPSREVVTNRDEQSDGLTVLQIHCLTVSLLIGLVIARIHSVTVLQFNSSAVALSDSFTV